MIVILTKKAQVNGNWFAKGTEFDVDPEFGNQLIDQKVAKEKSETKTEIE